MKITNQVAKGFSSFADSRKQLQTYLHSPQELPPTLTALELLTKWPACPWEPRKQSAHRALRPTASRAPPLCSELLDPRQPDCPGLMCTRQFGCFGPGNRKLVPGPGPGLEATLRSVGWPVTAQPIFLPCPWPSGHRPGCPGLKGGPV